MTAASAAGSIEVIASDAAMPHKTRSIASSSAKSEIKAASARAVTVTSAFSSKGSERR